MSAPKKDKKMVYLTAFVSGLWSDSHANITKLIGSMYQTLETIFF